MIVTTKLLSTVSKRRRAYDTDTCDFFVNNGKDDTYYDHTNDAYFHTRSYLYSESCKEQP